MSRDVSERLAGQSTGSSTYTTQRLNRLAVWSLVLAILTVGGIGSVLGVVFGVKARSQIQREGGRGLGLATAGIVVGVLTFVGAIVYWVIIARHFGGGNGGGGNGGGGGY